MTMSNDRAFLRHQILNALTLVGFAVSDAGLKEKKEREIMEQVKLIGLLVSKQDLLLGKAEKTSKQSVNLTEIFELILLIHEKAIKKAGVHISMRLSGPNVMGDPKIIKEALEHILLAVMDLSKRIEIGMGKGGRTLTIKYKSAKTVMVPTGSPMECLRATDDYSQIAFSVAMYLLGLNDIKTTFKKGLVEMVFPG